MAIDMSQFYQVFFEESAEHLGEMEALLLDLDIENPDSEQLNAIFRAAHSIKGSAGTFGFTDLAGLTHVLENLLDSIRKQELGLRPDMVDAFLEAGDILKDMLAAHQGQGSVDLDAAESIRVRLQQLNSQGGVVAAAPPAIPPAPAVSAEIVPDPQPLGQHGGARTYDIEFVPTANASAGEGVKNFIEDLEKIGAVTVVVKPTADVDQVGFWHLRLQTSVGQDSFSDTLDFISESGAWRVAEDKSVDETGSQAFGLFSEAPGTPDDNRGYGFFDPFPELETQSSKALDASDGSYGFFDPPVASAPAETAIAPSAASGASTGEDADQGYGFFEPIAHVTEEKSPVQPDVVPSPAPTKDVEGDGYGFFAPVQEPPKQPIVTVQTPSQVAQAPVVPSNDKPAAAPVAPQPPVAVAPDSGAGRAARTPKSNAPVAGGDTSIRVSVEKVDQLINLVGELVITQAMLLQTSLKMEAGAPESLINGLSQLERNTRDLQETVMSIRMMPISFVFSRFPRVVRDVSSKLGKQVELKTSGENTELDKGLIEKIADPLTHLIRNSLDHGIESPEKRVAAGKSPIGTITLRAYHQGGNIVIEVGDDGAGLNRQKILSKAREKGMQVSDQLTDQEVFALIFEAGFSTADQITDVSGRGVGMDVVRKNIQALGGRVEIESMQGVGTRMTVRLPLTLAILDGMSVAVGDQTYIVPLSYVIESLQPTAAEIKTLSNQGRIVQVRGEYLPVVVLSELFGLSSQYTNFTEGIMIVLDADGAKAALFVDALVGQHQVVIKSLEANYRRVPGISGATIMGDGHVALILDVSAIADVAKTIMHKSV